MALFHQQLCIYLLFSIHFFYIFERNAFEMETRKGSSGEGAASKRLLKARNRSGFHIPGEEEYPT